MLHVLLTFDYELFMGENLGSYDDILFLPTQKLLDMLNSEKTPVTFFADVCSAVVHEQYKLTDYVNAFDAQLKDMILQGHDVQLHLHPSWYCASAQNGTLHLSPKGYRIHEFGFDQTDELSAQAIVRQGKQYLEKVCRQADAAYRCVAYRAGGFGVQPEQQLLQALLDNGIFIDSSVVPRMKNTSSANYYDFSDVPYSLNWWIHPSTGLTECAAKGNGLYEIPIATARPNLVKCLGIPKSKLSLPPAKPLGTYVAVENPPSVSKLSKLLHRFFDYRYISLDTRYYERVVEDLLSIYKKHHLQEEDGFVCLICHPKLLDDVRVENIRLLIRALSEDTRFSFTTFQKVAAQFLKK